MEAPPPPFKRRHRRSKGLKGRGKGLVDLKKWPAEPPAPTEVEAKRFASALFSLCGYLGPKRKRLYSKWTLEAAATFDVDPFLLGALIFRQSRCRSWESDKFGIGLTKIDPRMHARSWDRKTRLYTYYVLEKGAWVAHTLHLEKHPIYAGKLKKAEANLYLAAGLLSIAKAQCPANDGVFGSVPHRHYVSHFAWGDRVAGAGAEDRILRSRRRLIELYRGQPSAQSCGEFQGLSLQLPVEAGPRKITSPMGADRDKGRRRHMGIDFDSHGGEPVRAIADGRVSLAGVQLRKGTFSKPFEEARKTKPSKMAPGGFLVMVRHAKGLVSGYMHLSNYVVTTGQKVKQGDLLGYVGRSGMRRSAAHLHFELRHEGKHLNPFPHLARCLFARDETWVGRRVARQEKKDRRRRRYRRYKKRKAKLETETAKKK